jgi:hypothetical protein
MNCKNKKVAILGGGDNAFENYQFIQRKKPSSVTIFARHVRAQLGFVKKIKKGDLFVGNYKVDPIKKEVNGQPFDFLVVMYGWQPVNPIEPFFKLKTQKKFLKTNRTRRTSQDGIYALGEVGTFMAPQALLEVPYLLVPACISSAVLHPSIRFFTRKSFERLANKAGLRVRRQVGVGLPIAVIDRGGPSPSRSMRTLGTLDRTGLKLAPGLFSYQLLFELEPVE